MAPTGLRFTVGSTWRMDLDTFRKDLPKTNIVGEKDFPNFCDQQKRSGTNGFLVENKESLRFRPQKERDEKKKVFENQG